MPASRGGDGDDEDGGDDEDESWLEKFLKSLLKQFWNPGFLWMTATDKAVARRLAALKDFGPLVSLLPKVGLPSKIGLLDPQLFWGAFDDFAGPLMKNLEWDDVVRAAGRAVGDASVAPMFAIGWGLTLLPEQIRNVTEGADWSEIRADLLVDSGGFLVSEGVGWIVGSALAETGPAAIGAKLGADVLAGAYWDTRADAGDWRETLAELLQSEQSPTGVGRGGPVVSGTPTPPPKDDHQEVHIPTPVPVPHPQATSTPSPGDP